MTDDKVVQKLYDSLKEKIKENGSCDSELIEKAFRFALENHGEQRRATGELYITHPLNAAIILTDLCLDCAALAAALLHDVVEDCDVSIETIKKEFGNEIAEIVEGVTKLTRMPFESKEEAQTENLRRMLLAMSKDIRVIIVKMADRLHNIRTLEGVSEEKQKRVSLETMEIYAPLAHRLGMQLVKLEIEDTSLLYLDPIGYADIQKELAEFESLERMSLDSVMTKIDEKLKNYSFDVFIEGRRKSVYSIYRKMYGQNKTLGQIYDLYAVRIICNTVAECYNILGVMHEVFKPVPNRFKDYIATPKPNMYQSLHTTLMSGEGIPFEVQIRTWNMHKTAEYGIAAHWKYKDGVSKYDEDDDKLEWIKNLVSIKEESGSEDFLLAFKIDLFADEVFVFTPKGDVKSLPLGSTPIDFAYAIHSGVGNSMVGAKIDGKIVNIETPLENGVRVDILTSSASRGPSRDWLKVVKTGEAKNKIKQWFKKEQRDENITQGHSQLERELKRASIQINDQKTLDILASIMSKNGLKTMDDMFASIGYGGIPLSKVVNKIKEDYTRSVKMSAEDAIVEKVLNEGEYTGNIHVRKSKGDKVTVEGMASCLVKYAKCCNPLPGDEVTGYITRGYGVSVHKRDCTNVIASKKSDDTARWVKVQWEEHEKSAVGEFDASIQVIASDRNELLADIMVALSVIHIPIRSIHAKGMQTGIASVNITVGVKDTAHLDSVLITLSKVKDIIKVVRY